MGMKMDISGKVALVTGASRGIGKAIALELASNGVIVIINYLKNDELAQEVVGRIKDMGGRSFKIKANIQDFSEAKDLVLQIIKKSGRIDFLINNAGINRDRTIVKMSLDEWKNVIDTNLNGAFNVTKSVITHMIEQEFGRIINISSVIGLSGNFGQSNYAASKAGLIGFTKSIAKELAKKGITVNAIAPGFMETDMLTSVPQKVKEELIKRIPLGRFGNPSEVAKLVLFMLSFGDYITGNVIKIDGGFYI